MWSSRENTNVTVRSSLELLPETVVHAVVCHNNMKIVDLCNDEIVKVLSSLPAASLAACLASCKALAMLDDGVDSGCLWHVAYIERWGGTITPEYSYKAEYFVRHACELESAKEDIAPVVKEDVIDRVRGGVLRYASSPGAAQTLISTWSSGLHGLLLQEHHNFAASDNFHYSFALWGLGGSLTMIHHSIAASELGGDLKTRVVAHLISPAAVLSMFNVTAALDGELTTSRCASMHLSLCQTTLPYAMEDTDFWFVPVLMDTCDSLMLFESMVVCPPGQPSFLPKLGVEERVRREMSRPACPPSSQVIDQLVAHLNLGGTTVQPDDVLLALLLTVGMEADEWVTTPNQTTVSDVMTPYWMRKQYHIWRYEGAHGDLEEESEDEESGDEGGDEEDGEGDEGVSTEYSRLSWSKASSQAH